jgi:hypothetical protein
VVNTAHQLREDRHVHDRESSDSYLLPVFVAVFLGTAIIQPGRFNPIGTWIGVYFLYRGILGLEDLGLQQWVSDVFYGGPWSWRSRSPPCCAAGARRRADRGPGQVTRTVL